MPIAPVIGSIAAPLLLQLLFSALGDKSNTATASQGGGVAATTPPANATKTNRLAAFGNKYGGTAATSGSLLLSILLPVIANYMSNKGAVKGIQEQQKHKRKANWANMLNQADSQYFGGNPLSVHAASETGEGQVANAMANAEANNYAFGLSQIGNAARLAQLRNLQGTDALTNIVLARELGLTPSGAEHFSTNQSVQQGKRL